MQLVTSLHIINNYAVIYMSSITASSIPLSIHHFDHGIRLSIYIYIYQTEERHIHNLHKHTSLYCALIENTLKTTLIEQSLTTIKRLHNYRYSQTSTKHACACR